MNGTRFHYFTPDGLPPNGCVLPGQGRPPHAPLGNSYPPHPYGYPAGPAYGPYYPITPQWCPSPPSQPTWNQHYSPPRWQVCQQPLPPILQTKPESPKPNPNVTFPSNSIVDGITVGMPNGTGYMFPEKNTVIHVLGFGFRPWENPNAAFQHQALVTPDAMTVNEFICRLERKFGTGKLKVTELCQLGNGQWQKRSSFVRDGWHTDKRLGEVGWGGQGKDGVPPLWVGLEAA